MLSPRAVGEDPSSPLVVAGTPWCSWLADMSHQSLPPSSHAVKGLCLIFLLFIRTLVIRLDTTHTNPVISNHLNLVISTKILLPNKVTFTGSKGQD